MKFSSPVTIYLSVCLGVSVCVCAQPFSMYRPRFPLPPPPADFWHLKQTKLVRALRCWLLWHLFIIQFKARLFAASKGLALLLRIAGWQLWPLSERDFQKTLAFFTTRARFLTPTRLTGSGETWQTKAVKLYSLRNTPGQVPHGAPKLSRVVARNIWGFFFLESVLELLISETNKKMREEKKKITEKENAWEAYRNSRLNDALCIRLYTYVIQYKALY